jgi:MraZ protein
MSFFKGRELYSVDAKGRINVPAKMRRSMSPEANDTFVVTRGPDDDPCIYAYPLDEWKTFEEGLKRLNQYNEQDRFFLRTLLYWAEEVTLDAQARIMAPRALLEFARIEKSVLILGSIDHVELWNPAVFDGYLAKRDATYASVAATVMGNGRP